MEGKCESVEDREGGGKKGVLGVGYCASVCKGHDR
jgi:hypothetical protein